MRGQTSALTTLDVIVAECRRIGNLTEDCPLKEVWISNLRQSDFEFSIEYVAALATAYTRATTTFRYSNGNIPFKRMGGANGLNIPREVAETYKGRIGISTNSEIICWYAWGRVTSTLHVPRAHVRTGAGTSTLNFAPTSTS